MASAPPSSAPSTIDTPWIAPMPAILLTRSSSLEVTPAMYACTVGPIAASATPNSMPRVIRKRRKSTGFVRPPSTAIREMTANAAMASVAVLRATIRMGLRPRDRESRPQSELVAARARAAVLIVTPTCHSSRPTSRASGAMMGLRICCPRNAIRVIA